MISKSKANYSDFYHRHSITENTTKFNHFPLHPWLFCFAHLNNLFLPQMAKHGF